MSTVLRGFLFLSVISLIASRGSAQQNGTALPGNEDAIVAIVDGESIRMRDLDEYSRSQDPKRLFQLNQQLYDLREQMLDQLIGERLLTQEAQRLNLSVEQLLTANVKVAPVTEASVIEMFERVNSQQPPAQQVGIDVARPMITMYLEGRQKSEARARYIQELKEAKKRARKEVSIRLEPPRLPVTGTAADPTKGAGEVEIVEFADFECVYCKQLEPVLKDVLTRFEGQIKFVWKDYPLPNHAFARSAAEAARCANDQGQFWQYRDVLFANQQALSPNDLKRHADTVGLDTKVFSQCLDGGKYRSEVTAAFQRASGYGLSATPTVFINGRMIAGVAPPETYQRIVGQELEASRR